MDGYAEVSRRAAFYELDNRLETTIDYKVRKDCVSFFNDFLQMMTEKRIKKDEVLENIGSKLRGKILNDSMTIKAMRLMKQMSLA